MHLKRIELQGFKTFAKKTVVEFPEPEKNKKAITVVVGPNGSGKSNLADAIRWCLGEQSMKQLRGKKSEDIIFSGSKGKSRSGFAEVVMVFDNVDDSFPVEFAEVAISRRLYRDGNSEYLLNGKSVRLQDIQLLLAEGGIGQRSYSVIGQGMIDHVLTSSPEERKVFFDDAMGVRGFQIKRHQALNKLSRSEDNLAEVERILDEIEPRLRILKRQVKRLEEREEVEERLKAVQADYYAVILNDLTKEANDARAIEAKYNDQISTKEAEITTLDEKLAELEKKIKADQKEEVKTDDSRDELREKEAELKKLERAVFEAEREIEIAKVQFQSKWSPMPLNKILESIEAIQNNQKSVFAKVKSAKDISEIESLISEIDNIENSVDDLRGRLTRPQEDDFVADSKLTEAVNKAKAGRDAKQAEIKALEAKIDEARKEKKQVKQETNELFDIQRKLRELQRELHVLETEAHSVNIRIARADTRIDGVHQEIAEQFSGSMEDIQVARQSLSKKSAESLKDEVNKLLRKRDLIGGIDEEVVQEFKETEERYNHLEEQSSDIKKALIETRKVIKELDERIKKQSEGAFKAINKQFSNYFKQLFGGGSAKLMELYPEDEEDGAQVSLDRALEALAHEEVEDLSPHKPAKDEVIGIDIQATPPNKKLKSLNLLSGGEKALTSIALLSAIMGTNPSPFVVLDEVDAALDETNTMKFANILEELQEKTQFIVITHNRATMEKADLLYGVTMGDEGHSTLIGVELKDIADEGTARR